MIILILRRLTFVNVWLIIRSKVTKISFSLGIRWMFLNVLWKTIFIVSMWWFWEFINNKFDSFFMFWIVFALYLWDSSSAIVWLLILIWKLSLILILIEDSRSVNCVISECIKVLEVAFYLRCLLCFQFSLSFSPELYFGASFNWFKDWTILPECWFTSHWFL